VNLARICKYIVIAALAAWIVPALFLARVEPGEIGVRQSALSGVRDTDLAPGWTWRIPGVHKVIRLPAHYEFFDYTEDDVNVQRPLQIRTKDNNIVVLDVSVPVRIRHGEAHSMVSAGNHTKDADGRYRFQRLAEETTVSVLREDLADLTSQGFYSTSDRLAVADTTLEVLNKSLEPLHLEAKAVLIRAVRFRPEYENQLQQIQLNEQNKLLDKARERVANEQQQLDNYVEATRALAAAKQQDWVRRQAELERAYLVGFIDIEGDQQPGAARRVLDALADAERAELATGARAMFDLAEDQDVPPQYLLGIKNIQAETLEYRQRVRTEADGISARLSAEGEAKIATVRGQFESRLNQLLNSPAGRAYVAWKTAANVDFADTLTFSSSDGIPSVLRLRDFAQRFMGSR